MEADERAAYLGVELEVKMRVVLESMRSTCTNMHLFLHASLTPNITVLSMFGQEEPVSISRESHIQDVVEFVKANPDYRIEVLSQSPPTISMGTFPPQATTYAAVHITGLPGLASEKDTIAREAMIVCNWCLEDDGCWRIYQHLSIRGPGAMSL